VKIKFEFAEEDALNIADYKYQPRPTNEEMAKLIDENLTDEIINSLPELLSAQFTTPCQFFS